MLKQKQYIKVYNTTYDNAIYCWNLGEPTGVTFFQVYQSIVYLANREG